MAGGGVIGLLSIALWLFHVPIFRLLGADAATLSYIYIYWGPQLLSAWLGALLYFSYSVFRAHGDTRLPGKMMVLSSLVNLALDPLLIFGVGDWEGWGLPGAAWATAIAFTVGLMVTTRKLLKRQWASQLGLWLEAKQSWRPLQASPPQRWSAN
ncbi:hypothetical protein HORIV_31940 [Vreelandella olivaria]|uniref:Polysaccharide biosynthesis protein C-terminal domain-containing protein n=1 Tax=Vreelandella olivaria TaxID=390919 RepID=A0ABN5X0Y8_9GAMM|nr:hypothetical protein HORIV_31940 [Halomonas olivaria]